MPGEQDGIGSGFGGGDDQAAFPFAPGQRQPLRIDLGFGWLQQLRVERLDHQVDERQVEVPRIAFVVAARVDKVARQQRIAEPHIPSLGEGDRFVELGEGEDASPDQQIAERTI